MALRLSPASAPAVPAAQRPAASSAAAPARLHERARALLAQADLAGYDALFAEAAAIEDVHRRYQARCLLLQAGLGAGATVAAVARACASALRQAVVLLEEDPREPRLLNLAGMALYELGELPAAERLFTAAGRLDPELPHVAGNLAEVARRRRAGASRPALPPVVLAALRGLAPRAKRIASAARPAEGLRLSLCMIVKDEEVMLPRCLAAVRDAVDEIVVVDTGSTDRTREIAASFGARVLDVPWTGSFADARNASFEAATGDWLLYLDADEVLVAEDAPKLRALCGRTWREAFYLIETNHTGALEDGTAMTHNALRLFRNRPGLRFEGRLHEQIAQHLPGYLPERLEVSEVRVEHFGYLGEVRGAKDKARRNLELLERQGADGDDTPFHHFNLGSEHAAVGDAAAALRHFDRAWRAVREDETALRAGYVTALAGRLVRAQRLAGRPGEARRTGQEVLERFPGFTDVLLEQALAAAALGDADTAAAELGRCLEWGDAPSRYSPSVGAGTFGALIALAGLERRRGDLARAEGLLRRCRAEHPAVLAAVEPLAGVLLARGASPADVVAELEGAADLGAPTRFMLAVALHEAGAAAEAEAQLRLVLAAQPVAEPARVALAETLLSQGRLDEAAEVAGAVAGDSPHAAAAARTALFARLAGEAGGPVVDGALQRARAAGLPAAELEAFEAWRRVGAGGTAPDRVPAPAAPAVLAMVEALLRLEAFDPFAALLPVAEALALPPRERREALAAIYLRRGFLESAADEWIAAVQEHGADVRALRGLSAVAAARGMEEDALVLAQEAEALAA